jgi:protease-4
MTMPPPPPPKRDRVALAVVAFIFGGFFLLAFGVLFLTWGAVHGEPTHVGKGPKIGVIEVKGPIGMAGDGVDAERVLRNLRKFEADDAIKAILVRIDSPGGSVGPSQEIHDEVLRVAKTKTVVCSMGQVAASGGFYVAMGCPKGTVVAEPGTITGSIGVISEFPNLSRIAQRFEFKVETIKSGPLKDAGNPLRDMTGPEREYWQALIDRVYAQFVGAVAESRGMEEKAVRRIADGRVITGEEAAELGLIDKLGNFYVAVDLALELAKVKEKGEPELVYPRDDRARFIEQLLGGAARSAVRAARDELAATATDGGSPGVYFLAR